MTDTDTQVGQVVHYDLYTAEPIGSVAFYCAITGWTTNVVPFADATYTMFVDGDEPIGGIEAPAFGGPARWIGYVRVADVDDTLARVVEAGGSVVKAKTSILPTSSYALFADPEGAVCGIYAGETDPGRGAQPGPGRFSWAELAANDWEAATEFYVTLFGWERAETMEMGPAGIYQLFRQAGAPDHWHLGGIMNKPPEAPQPYWLYYISVPDLDATIARVEQLGGTVLFPPTSVGGDDRITQCIDPQGTMFALHG